MTHPHALLDQVVLISLKFKIQTVDVLRVFSRGLFHPGVVGPGFRVVGSRFAQALQGVPVSLEVLSCFGGSYGGLERICAEDG